MFSHNKRYTCELSTLSTVLVLTFKIFAVPILTMNRTVSHIKPYLSSHLPYLLSQKGCGKPVLTRDCRCSKYINILNILNNIYV